MSSSNKSRNLSHGPTQIGPALGIHQYNKDLILFHLDLPFIAASRSLKKYLPVTKDKIYETVVYGLTIHCNI